MSRAEGQTGFQTHNLRPACPSTVLTSKPALPVPVLGVLQPGQVPGVSKVHQQDELDDDEDEGAHHAKVVPDWEETAPPVSHLETLWTRPPPSGFLTCVKVSIGDEEGSHRDPHQHQELEEPEPETKKQKQSEGCSAHACPAGGSRRS